MLATSSLVRNGNVSEVLQVDLRFSEFNGWLQTIVKPSMRRAVEWVIRDLSAPKKLF